MNNGFHIVLYAPEIPQNTGNIMRTCAATGAHLHLIEPLGFSLDEKHLRRSATYHVPLCDYTVHASWDAFLAETPSDAEFFFMTRHGDKAPSDCDFVGRLRGHELYLVFGREDTGLPHELLALHPESLIRLPMVAGVASLNLSNAVCVTLYEALRQCGYPGLSRSDEGPAEEWESFDAFVR